MPGKPRFYNNRRPLNPRHVIVAPNAGAVTLANVGVLQVSITDTNELTWDFDTDILELGDFQNIEMLPSTPDSDFADPDVTAEPPTSVEQIGPRTIVAQYSSAPNENTSIAYLHPGGGTGVQFIGRNVRELPTFYSLQAP